MGDEGRSGRVGNQTRGGGRKEGQEEGQEGEEEREEDGEKIYISGKWKERRQELNKVHSHTSLAVQNMFFFLGMR